MHAGRAGRATAEPERPVETPSELLSWQPLRRLGRGPLTSVWLARGSAGELLAVKIPRATYRSDPAVATLLRREGELLRSVAGPGVVRLIGLAEQALVFDRVVAASSHTVPSHTTLFTGLHMPQHRVLMADHRQLSYTLRLPGAPPITGAGPGHRAACLERLALYGL